jgi:ketosteroid isomerase-like protein
VGGDLLEFVRSIYAPWERGDFSSVAWTDSEIEFAAADGPLKGSWSGYDEMARAWGQMLSAWENFTVEVEQYLQLDDERVLVLLDNHGRGKASGVDVEQIAARTANLLHVQEDKVIRFVMYWDRERAFENLGIDPDALPGSHPPSGA